MLKALQAARERVRESGIEVQLVPGDVTALRRLGVGTGFRFVLDFGLFHGLDDTQREAMGREVTAVAAPSATLLMMAWAPGTWLLRGASRGDIEAAYPTWKLIDEEPFDVSGAPFYRFVRNADPRFYRLRLGEGTQHEVGRRDPP